MTALLFDLDGTLVDSDPEHLAAFQRVFAPHGIALDRADYAREIMGASNDAIARRSSRISPPGEQAATLDAKEEAYRDGLGALEPIAGARRVARLRRPARAEARGGHQRAARQRRKGARRARHWRRACRSWSSAAELARSKPDPLPYLTGARAHRRARPTHSLAFEDSLSGVRAAAARGLAVVGMTTTRSTRDA